MEILPSSSVKTEYSQGCCSFAGLGWGQEQSGWTMSGVLVLSQG